MRRIILFGILVNMTLVLCQCGNTIKNESRNYVDEKLIAVMIDLYTAEAAMQDINVELQDSLTSLYRDQISAIHAVDIKLVEEDLERLQSDLPQYESLHQIVKDSIYAIEKRTSGLITKNAKKSTSKEKIKKQLK